MEPTNPVEQEAPEPQKAKRVASTISFPYTDLNDAIAIARAIWEHVGASTCDLPQLAAWAGHDTIESGAFRIRVSSARLFGLVLTGSKQVSVTDLGRATLDPDRAGQARAEAFLNVPLYRQLFGRYEGQTLPTTNVALQADLVDLGVAEKQKDKARQVFQRSAEQAGYFAQGRNRLVRPAFREEQKAPVVESEPKGGGGSGGGIDHPYVQLLVQSLPEPGTIWPESERIKWIALAKAAFNVVYKDDVASPSSEPSAPQPPSERSPDVPQG